MKPPGERKGLDILLLLLGYHNFDYQTKHSLKNENQRPVSFMVIGQ
jgi:hypothetical protein